MDKAAYIANVLAQAGTGGKGGRGVTKSRLLDDSDQNIGNAAIVMPQALGPGNTAQLTPELNPPRLLALDALSPTGQVVTVTLVAAAVLDSGSTSPQGTVGPITGIIEFGNGSVSTRVEVDVPVGPYFYISGSTVAQAQQPRDGGTIITVPSGTLRVYARNDACFVTPAATLGAGGAFQSAGTRPPCATAGSAAPVPVRVQAFVSYFTRSSILTPRKSLYLGGNNVDGLVYSIPPFAKRFRILRSDTLVAFTIKAQFRDGVNGGNALATVDYPGGVVTPIPFTEIPGTANAIVLSAPGPFVNTSQVVLEFEIQI